ncbi:hypothetical protein Aph01nite_67210 [Acrocarpospora phusangensis]|uniref:DUF3616 domain-containing protein n=1 Tax=Acrocarpospora phusangensis TaxID=1070424 RepID=A0A919UNE4_9ACTN|nr:DUF3616 domain-containing protein [Acrocarpospora phusangensis]GIH28411.1 hypothetical protein Aph01nite_67210 [Acrocarpospora phusangensis]
MHVELRFAPGTGVHHDLSAVRQDGRCLWVAGDESAAIERLTWRDGAYQDHHTFRLSEFVHLPAGPDDEADIEGLARTDGWLWAVGSHSLKRKRVKPGQTGEKARRRLSTVLREENRYILLRLPLVERDGLPVPVRKDGRRTAAMLCGPGRNLADMLTDDPHLGPFLNLPGKDNGFDIEGIAVISSRVLVGLRGPVLRGWAVVVEIRPETHDSDKLRVEGYRTHFVDLGGLGIRDLCPVGDDLLILAGPTMTHDGPFRVLRWRPNGDFANPPALVAELPMIPGADRPEGIALLTDGRLLVVYDSPSPNRLTLDGVYADIVQI